MADWEPWDEDEYVEYLETERLHYAWALEHFGRLTADEARQAALEFYEFEPPDAPYRGIVFHDLAWDWAMQRIMAGCDYPFWHTHPVPEPPPDYPGYVERRPVELTAEQEEALERRLKNP
ncbi:hypothetical protein ACFWNN_21405 [Lentzea sp. NPDC058450]|uniref:hypothetical protein n=1 Tax=Lentzea sp. NPDC058450 TaxID=3346505 RepID=UPI00365DE259